LLDERVPATKPLERDDALFELARRYFRTRGPATVDDFAWWSGLTKTDAKKGAHAAESELHHEIIGGRSYWFPKPTRLRTKSPLTRLLPNFDEFFIGLKDRSAMLSRLGTLELEASLGFLGSHLVTIEGQVVGGWKRAFTGKRTIVDVKTLTTLGERERRSIVREVKRFAAFLGTPVELVTATP
jgi:hypothetical protein